MAKEYCIKKIIMVTKYRSNTISTKERILIDDNRNLIYKYLAYIYIS
jgi:hypothetical protein